MFALASKKLTLHTQHKTLNVPCAICYVPHMDKILNKLLVFLKLTYSCRHRRDAIGAGGRGARRRVRGTLHPTYHMLHTQRYTHNSAKYTLDTYTLHTKHYTLNTTKCTLNTTHSTLHTTHSPGTATAPLELFVAARADACGVCGGRNASCTGYEP